jgi:iron complex outermembrane receptor protein
VNDAHEERQLGALAVDYRAERLRLSADLGHQKQDLDGVVHPIFFTGAVSTIPSPPDPKLNSGQPWSYNEVTDNWTVFRGELDVTENTTVHAAWGRHKWERTMLHSGTVVVLDANGDASAWPNLVMDDVTTDSGEIGLRTRLGTGPVQHEFAVSAVRNKSVTDQGFAMAAAPYATNIYSPAIVARPDIEITAFGKVEERELSSVGIADTLSAFDKRIQLTLGARQQTAKQAYFDAATGTQFYDYDDDALTPAVALVVKPLENMSLYANMIEGLQFGEVVDPSYANGGTVFPPYKSRQYEAGMKIDWGRWTTTLSVFQITQPSVVTDVAANTRVLDGEQRNRGVELNVFGQPLNSVRLVGGAMFIDPVLTKTADGLMDGMTASRTPAFQLRLSGEWDTSFLRGLTLTGRVVYTGEQYYDNANTSPRRTISASTRLDAGARYTFDGATTPTHKPIVVRLNVENLLNEAYWLGTNYVAPPRTVWLSASFDF